MTRVPADLGQACSVVAAECVCSNVRQLARSLTQSYDRALRPSGLRASQMPILVALAIAGSSSISTLGQYLGMDRTTLTRNLRPLQKAKWVQVVQDADDRRQRLVELTAAGAAILGRAMPLWRRVQTETLNRLGGNRWPGVLKQIQTLSEAPSTRS